MRVVQKWKKLLASCIALAMFLYSLLAAPCCSAAAAHPGAAQTDQTIARCSSDVSDKLLHQQEQQQDLAEMVKESSSKILAQTIIYLRDLALQDAKPIPLDIQYRLAPYFPASILQKVKYSIAWNPLVRSTLREFIDTDRYSLAFTLDYVVVFADEGGIEDLWLWAHELTHVQQYERWGVETFARFYISNYREVEKEAHGYANQVLRKIIMLSSSQNKEYSKEHP